MYYLLLSLYEERTGAEIVSYVNQITDGRVNLPPETLYALLAIFVDDQLIELSKTKGNSKKYRITGYGKKILEEEKNRLEQLVNDYSKFIK